MMKDAAILAFAVVGFLSCKPVCTHCPNVAGTYSEDSTTATNTCDGDSITWDGDTGGTVVVTQKESQLNVTWTAPGGGTSYSLSGTLYADNTATFPPVDVTPVDQVSGEAITDGATLALSGTFSTDVAATFSGTWSLELVNDYGCTASSMTTWTPASSN